jgi:hypothetical protein
MLGGCASSPARVGSSPAPELHWRWYYLDASAGLERRDASGQLLERIALPEAQGYFCVSPKSAQDLLEAARAGLVELGL